MSTRSEIKDQVFMDVAHTIGELSTCNRLKVGAVITRLGRAVSWGYNGAPPGAPHCRHADDEPCTNATHAEANALAFAARAGISTEGSTCYVVVSPCANCARLLIAAGVKRVWFEKAYRDPEGIAILRAAGVACSPLP